MHHLKSFGKEVKKQSASVASTIINFTSNNNGVSADKEIPLTVDNNNNASAPPGAPIASSVTLHTEEQQMQGEGTQANETLTRSRSISSSSSSWSERLSSIIKREWEWVDESSLQGYDESSITHHSQNATTSRFSLLPRITIQYDGVGEHISDIVLQQSDVMYSLYEKYANATMSLVDSAQTTTSSTLSFLYNNCLQMSSVTCGTWSQDTADYYVHKIPTSFAMSGCGWLIPFHLGVIQAFKDAGYINEETVFAGTSGGAIGALVGCMDIPTEEALEQLIQLSADEKFKMNIDEGLKEVLKRIVRLHSYKDLRNPTSDEPFDPILARCNDRLHVTVTKLWPKLTLVPIIVSNYDSADHLLDVIAASCFIPLYSSPLKMMTNIAKSTASKVIDATIATIEDIEIGVSSSEMASTTLGSGAIDNETERINNQQPIESEYYIDGGVFAFVPPVGEVKISPFPSKYIRSFVEADITLSSDDFSLRQLLTWVLYPASEEVLRELYAKGKKAALAWIQKHEEHIRNEEFKQEHSRLGSSFEQNSVDSKAETSNA